MKQMSTRDLASFWNRGCIRVYDDELDLHRVQADLLNVPTSVQEIYNHIEEMLEAANDVWRLDPTGGHALISHAGSQDQAVHCNFPAFETVQALLVHVTVRASFIVALLDDTFLHVYPGFFWAEAEIEARCTLRLLPGEMVTFRGDPAYAGAWYRTRTFACIVTCWSMGSNKRKIRQKP
ncbi:hypothetical protein GQ600_16891 [Phytophthora cactorum]|nr:hypothetical protein GQ600_16891 [Phytophthora cactorum]